MRLPKPFFRTQTQSWYVRIDRKDYPLGNDEAQAWQRYHELMAARAKGRALLQDVSVGTLLNLHLTWLQRHRAKTTFENRLPRLQSFGRFIGGSLKVRSLKPHHVQSWLDAKYAKVADTTVNVLVTMVKRVFEWGIEMGYTEINPIARMKKPAASMRELYLPAALWPKVLAAARDEPFRDYLIVMLGTGARAEEMRKFEVRHLDRQGHCLVLPKGEAKGRKRARVVYLPDEPFAIVCRLADLHLDGELFRNSRGVPWTKSAIAQRFATLKDKLKEPKLCATTLRHSFAYQRLVDGQPLIVVEKLLGHVDGRMLETRYSHLHQDVKFMQAQANLFQTPNPAQPPEPIVAPPPTGSADAPTQTA